jgi:PAS domain S-box-containing protein
VRAAHYWTKLHPELKFEADITTLLETHEALADCVINDPVAVSDNSKSHVAVDELASFHEMRKLQAKLAAIVESSDDAIISKDLNGVIQSWNGGAERLFGYAADEVIGKSITIIIPADRLKEEPEIISRLERGERIEHFETIRKSKSGSLLNISLTVSPVKDATGKVIGASKVARDITERKRQEEALHAANTAVIRSNADLQQFAYSASHDLQEPLRMVATYSELLKEEFGGKLGETGEMYLAHTVRGVARMERLLSDLRAYVHVSVSGQEPTEEIDSGAAIDRALTNLEVAIRENGASITRTSLPAVRIHQFELELLFQNLIGNAIRYRSGDPPQVQVMARREGTHWLFSVHDNGIGIEPEYQEQIFGMFQRLHNAPEYPGRAITRAKEIAQDADLRKVAPEGFFSLDGKPIQTTPGDHNSRPQDSRLPLPGAMRRRKWKGRTIFVEVLAKGFRCENQQYTSLSAVATRWNGLAFFGLTVAYAKK